MQIFPYNPCIPLREMVKNVVKCGYNQEKVTRKIPIASAHQPRLFLCYIVTLIQKLFKSL